MNTFTKVRAIFCALILLVLSSFAVQPAVAAECETPGFVRVAANSPYFGQAYCIMEKEAVNPATGEPWNFVSFSQLQTICSFYTPNSELPVNVMHQGIARAAEAIAANWTGGAVGSGALKTDLLVPDGLGGYSMLYDFGDGLWEWTRGIKVTISAGFIHNLTAGGSSVSINGLSLTLKDHFGPSGTYGSGAELGVLTQPTGVGIARGGDDSEPGAFGVAENHDNTYGPGYSDFGGRCAYPAIDDN